MNFYKRGSLIVCLLFFGILNAQKFDDSVTLKKFENIPNVSYKTINDSTKYFADIFRESKATVLVFFSPTCDHCVEEITHVQREIANFNHTQFILITNRPKLILDTFITNHHFDTIPNFHFAIDTTNELLRYYEIGGYPSMVVYNFWKNPIVKYNQSIVPPKLIWEATLKRKD